MQNLSIIFLCLLSLVNTYSLAQVDSLTYERYRVMYEYAKERLNKDELVIKWILYEEDKEYQGYLELETQEEVVRFRESRVSYTFDSQQLSSCLKNTDSLSYYQYSDDNTPLMIKEVKDISHNNSSPFKLYYSRPFQSIYTCEIIRSKRPESKEEYTDINDFNNVCIFCFIFEEGITIKCVSYECLTYE